MVVQVHQQQVQRMTTTPTRWRVTKVNRNNNNNNNKKRTNEDTVVLCFVLGYNVLPHLLLLYV